MPQLFYSKWRKAYIAKYLRDLYANVKLWLAGIVQTYNAREKLFKILGLGLDVACTGGAVWFVVRYWGFWLSYGVAAAIIMFWIKWLVVTIKTPYGKA